MLDASTVQRSTNWIEANRFNLSCLMCDTARIDGSSECEISHTYFDTVLMHCMCQHSDGPLIIIDNNGGESQMPTQKIPVNAIYIKAHARAYHWACQAIVHRAKGDPSAASVAGKKVQLWLRRIARLQMQGEPTV